MRLFLGGVLLLLASVAGWALVVAPALDTPESQVARYLAATSRPDEAGALAAWQLHDGAPAPSAALIQRRNDLTRELLVDRVGAEFAVTSIEWWRTCCEPGRIDDPRNAGLARMHVSTHGKSGKEYRLVFEVWARDLTYWGDAGGSPPHNWSLYEVRFEDQACLFPNPSYGCVRER